MNLLRFTVTSTLDNECRKIVIFKENMKDLLNIFSYTYLYLVQTYFSHAEGCTEGIKGYSRADMNPIISPNSSNWVIASTEFSL